MNPIIHHIDMAVLCYRGYVELVPYMGDGDTLQLLPILYRTIDDRVEGSPKREYPSLFSELS